VGTQTGRESCNDADGHVMLSPVEEFNAHRESEARHVQEVLLLQARFKCFTCDLNTCVVGCGTVNTSPEEGNYSTYPVPFYVELQ